VRYCLIAILTVALTGPSIAVSAFGQQPPVVNPGARVQPADARQETAQLIVPHLLPSLAQDKEAAGLPQQSQPELLTWDRVYPLALIRSRRARPTFRDALDPKELTGEANGFGVADFARFRREFLAPASAAGTSFRDPSADFLDLLRRVLTIDNARRNVAFHQNVWRFTAELIQGSSGLRRVDVDLISDAWIQARHRLASEIAEYRDRLDELKARLGLSPRAAVLPSRTSLGAFESGFRRVEDWIKKPDRRLDELPRIIQQFPLTGDLFIDGRPFLRRIDEVPDSMEAVLTEVGQLAVKNFAQTEKNPAPPEAVIDRELHARRRFRNLYETQQAYDREKKHYELAIRLADQSFERLCSPPDDSTTSRSTIVAALLEHADALRSSADRLVALWTTFRGERLALYRELGVLPFNDWDSFYAQFSAGPVGRQEAPPEEPANAIAPAIPPPPAPQ
jgi:hypothetical protein